MSLVYLAVLFLDIWLLMQLSVLLLALVLVHLCSWASSSSSKLVALVSPADTFCVARPLHLPDKLHHQEECMGPPLYLYIGVSNFTRQ